MWLPLREVVDAERFGGKAAQLGASMRAGLPVPGGAALSWRGVEACVSGHHHDALASLLAAAGRLAVRSSARGEDGGAASFAGQHLTVLNVGSQDALIDAIGRVHSSARQAAALAYRARLGILGPPRLAVVLQHMVEPVAAGVLFTRCPVSGRDERVIEAAWGLGEAVVGGLVEPDRVRMARGGVVLDWHVGVKDVAVRFAAQDDTETVSVAATRANAPCIDRADLAALEALAVAVERAFPGPSDIEWAFDTTHTLHLLQRRPVTR